MDKKKDQLLKEILEEEYEFKIHKLENAMIKQEIEFRKKLEEERAEKEIEKKSIKGI